ncbi:ABC transporter ATP-binding protein [Candidatus Falkowbacteria bacterium]|nr:ABC transporter ATP-binding protein [Candidatus Falkowbacteria bacterium]
MPFKEKFKFFWRYVKPHKNILLFFGFLSIIVAILSALSPYIFGKMIDLVLHQSRFLGMNYWQLGLLWLIITLISLFIDVYNDSQVSVEENKVERNFIIDFCHHVLKLPVSYHYSKKPGELIKVIDRTHAAINNMLEMVFLNSMPQFLTMLIAFIIMFMINWVLSLIMLVSVILFFLTSYFYQMKHILTGQREINEQYNGLYGHIGDMISNIFAVKTNTAERAEEQYNQKNYKNIFTLVERQMGYWFKLGLARGLVINVGRIIVVILAVYFFSQHKLSEGGVVMFIGYFGLIYFPLYNLSGNIRMLRRYLVDLEQAVKVYGQEEESDEKGSMDLEIKGNVEFAKVSFRYPEREERVMDNVSFKVKAGETLAIFGETGSGKTTLHNLFTRLFDSEDGQILIDNTDIRKISRKFLRAQIAVVPQDPALFNETIKYNIKYGNAEATNEQMIKAAKIANIHDFIESLPEKYETKVGERGIKLSGGQVQRIAIARAALRDPKILILDEATSSLDQKTKFEVLSALQKLIEGRTAIIITHDFSAITQSADQIIVLSEGKIAQQGAHNQLITKSGIYKDLWQMQQKHLLAVNE